MGDSDGCDQENPEASGLTGRCDRPTVCAAKPGADPAGSPSPRAAQNWAWGMRTWVPFNQRAVVPPPPLSRSLLLLSTSSQKWLQQPLALGSALHL